MVYNTKKFLGVDAAYPCKCAASKRVIAALRTEASMRAKSEESAVKDIVGVRQDLAMVAQQVMFMADMRRQLDRRIANLEQHITLLEKNLENAQDVILGMSGVQRFTAAGDPVP